MEIQGFKPVIGSHVQQWRFKFVEPKIVSSKLTTAIL